ncbi:hypothetical protein [Halomarina litorea]|uniref:hypothetical protein n=1 Tax=Halomarina litorea TaxID=2961595 RepID=UPI0020C29A05|nr:hypothetical protein [Halomarina sp. BCD28]
MVPPSTRRDALRRLAGALSSASTLALAGCLGDDSDGDSSPTQSATMTPTPTPSPDPNATTTPHPDPTRTRVHADQRVSYDHVVRLENDRDESRRVSIRVTAEDGAVVHEETYDLGPYEGRDAFDFSSLASGEIRAFTVRATHDGQSKSVLVRTTECYGNVLVAFTPEGEFVVTYSVC